MWRPPAPGGDKPFSNPMFMLPSTTVLNSDPYRVSVISHSRHTRGPPATAHSTCCIGCPPPRPGGVGREVTPPDYFLPQRRKRHRTALGEIVRGGVLPLDLGPLQPQPHLARAFCSVLHAAGWLSGIAEKASLCNQAAGIGLCPPPLLHSSGQTAPQFPDL